MTTTNAKATMLTGYPDFMGKHAFAVADYFGPSSYQTGGDIISALSVSAASTVPFRSIDAVCGDMSVSGTYRIAAQAVGTGPAKTFQIHWFVTATGAEVSANTDLHTESVKVLIIGS